MVASTVPVLLEASASGETLKYDHVSASAAFRNADDATKNLHITCCKYAAENGVSYVEAYNVVTLRARQTGTISASETLRRDHVSASKAFQNAPNDRQELHFAICKYAEEHDDSYVDAYLTITSKM